MKTRQLGISEMYAGGKLAYNYLFVSASQNIIVAGEQGDADHTFENCDRGLDLMANTQFYLERSVSKLQSNPLIKSKYTSSWIRSLSARDKPQIISKYSPYEIYYEEGERSSVFNIKIDEKHTPAGSKNNQFLNDQQ